MLKITAKVDGMMCGMCESHINDAVRRVFPVKKVTSSHFHPQKPGWDSRQHRLRSGHEMLPAG